jgi:hypothetical protein
MLHHSTKLDSLQGSMFDQCTNMRQIPESRDTDKTNSDVLENEIQYSSV